MQQRAVAVLARALDLLLGDARRYTTMPRSRSTWRFSAQQDRAAAGGEHDRRFARDVLEHLALARAKAASPSLERCTRCRRRCALDLGVAVVEGRAQQACELLADGGLAGAHQSDQEDVGGARATWRASIAEMKRPPDRRPLS